jgi:hypothetical protein
VLIDRGLVERGLTHLRDAVARAERIGAREVVLQARTRYAHAILSSGRAEESAETARAVLSSATALELQPLSCEAETVLSAALLELNQLDEASDIARRAVVRARLLGIRLHEASARCMLGLALVRTDGWTPGFAQLDGAATAFESMGARLQWARTLLATANAASLYAPKGARERLRGRLGAVLEIAETLRSETYRAEAQRLSAALTG